MKWVQQRNDTGCVAACLAMITDKDFYEVFDVVGGSVSIREMYQYLTDRGLKYTIEEYNYINPDAINLIQVPSLNVPARMHMIIVDTRDPHNGWCDVYDPNFGRENRKWYTQDMIKSWGGVVSVNAI